jgi:hypothetical protein
VTVPGEEMVPGTFFVPGTKETKGNGRLRSSGGARPSRFSAGFNSPPSPNRFNALGYGGFEKVSPKFSKLAGLS